jgi:hypothetical protein
VFPSPHLYPSDKARNLPTRVGIGGLRHKSRHNAPRPQRTRGQVGNCPDPGARTGRGTFGMSFPCKKTQKLGARVSFLCNLGIAASYRNSLRKVQIPGVFPCPRANPRMLCAMAGVRACTRKGADTSTSTSTNQLHRCTCRAGLTLATTRAPSLPRTRPN